MKKESSPTVFIKQEPELLQEEQEDLILSYLNTEYVSTESTTTDDPPSPPYSTSSVSTNGGDATTSSMDMDISGTDQPSLYLPDPFLFHLQTALTEQGLPLAWPSSTAALPSFPTDPSSCMMNIHPLFIPATQQPTSTSLLSQPLPIYPLQQDDIKEESVSLSPRSSCSSSSSDTEQSKRKRGGRKKREVSIAPAPMKPLTRILPASTTHDGGHHVPKLESSVASSLDQIPSTPHHHPYQRASISSTNSTHATPSSTPTTTTTASSAASNTSNTSTSSGNTSINDKPERSPAEIAYAKRQERLIKNRAAALLSRKRKREHLTTLEEERQHLVNENESLKSKVTNLEARVVSLEQENMELKNRLSSSSSSSSSSVATTTTATTSSLHKQHHHQHHHQHSSLATPKHAKTTGMVFMIILFSFALFTLPSRSADQLTVGGGSAKHNMPLIGSSPSRVPEIRLETVGATTETSPTSTSSSVPNATTDLVLVDHVRPGDLQSWVREQLVLQRQQQQQQQQQQQEDEQSVLSEDTTSLVQWRDRHAIPSPPSSSSSPPSRSARRLYLYANEFSELAPLQQPDDTPFSNDSPTLSILCPLNTTSPCERPAYLQIDVKVLGSRVLEGELKHIQHQKAPTSDNNEHKRKPIDDEDGDVFMLDVKGEEGLLQPVIIQALKEENTIIDRRRQLRKKKLLDEKRKRLARVVL